MRPLPLRESRAVVDGWIDMVAVATRTVDHPGWEGPGKTILFLSRKKTRANCSVKSDGPMAIN